MPFEGRQLANEWERRRTLLRSFRGAMIDRVEALLSAKRLLRGLSAAPDPRRAALGVFAELVKAEGWTAPEQGAIADLGLWLQGRPALTELKPRLAKVLSCLRQA